MNEQSQQQEPNGNRKEAENKPSNSRNSRKAKAPTAKKKKKGAPTGGNPTKKQKQELMEGKRVVQRGPNQDQQKLGLNSWESIPYTVGKYELVTPYSQYVVSRFRRNLAVNAYLAEVFPSAHGWKHWLEILQCIEKLVNQGHEKLEAVFEEVEGQVNHMCGVLCLEEDDLPQYINTRKLTYAITTPRVRQIMNYLPRLDQAVIHLEALWMAESGISSSYVRQESLRLRSAIMKYVGVLFRQSDRVRRVMAGRGTTAELLTTLQDELSEHYGDGLRDTDAKGNAMLLPGETDMDGPLVGEEKQKPEEITDASG